jgi:hypothetical protein
VPFRHMQPFAIFPWCPGPLANALAVPPSSIGRQRRRLAARAPLGEQSNGGLHHHNSLLKETFGFNILHCVKCKGRMRLLAVLTEERAGPALLRGIDEQIPAANPSA